MQKQRSWRYIAFFAISVLSAIAFYWVMAPAVLNPIATVAQPKSTVAQPKSFVITQFLYYDGKPNFAKYGIKPMFPLGNPQDYWVKPLNTEDSPDEQKTRAIARTGQSDAFYYVDIEHLSFEKIAVDVEKMAQIGRWVRSERPDLKFGFYGNPPFTSPWNRPASWKEANSKLHPIVQNVDFVMPDLYTVHTDPQRWLAQARETIAEAKQYKKPIYAFIMPFYHPGAGKELTNKPISGEYWRLQLETLYQSIDGIVIWAWAPGTTWKSIASETDPNNWWYQTLDFMKQKRLLTNPVS